MAAFFDRRAVAFHACPLLDRPAFKKPNSRGAILLREKRSRAGGLHRGGQEQTFHRGRIQKRKTYHLQIFTFGLQRAASPYRRANERHAQPGSFDNLVGAANERLWQ
jgi:hypothetical protein